MKSATIQVRSLRVFCDVVRRKSFSQAALDHDMTQSAASQTVQNLEEYLSVQLIDRTKRPFILTAEGQKFYDGLNTLLRQFDSLVEEVRQVGEEIRGRVTIAAIYSVGLSYLPAIEAEFRRLYPQAELQIRFEHPHEVYRMVEQGEVDLGLISYPEASKAIQATHWREEPMVLVASAKHPLAKLEEVAPSDLNEHGLIAFASNLRIRQEIQRNFRQHGVAMRIVAELDNIDSMKQAVMNNSGIAIVPEPAVTREVETGLLRILDCAELRFSRSLGVIQRRQVGLNRSARAFCDLLLADGHASESTDAVIAHHSTPHQPVGNLSSVHHPTQRQQQQEELSVL